MEVKKLVTEIKDNLKQNASSQKDEVRVMQAMLNDKEYKVGVYSKDGKVDEYCPAGDFRNMLTNMVAGTTKITKAESAALVDKYVVTKGDATTMVNVSKEFINTYLDTGRKLPLGGRETHNYALSKKDVKATVRTYPSRVGVKENGVNVYESAQKQVPAHASIKAYGPCPDWVK